MKGDVLRRRDRLSSVVAVVLLVAGLTVGLLVAAGRHRQVEAARADYLAVQRTAVERRLSDTVSELVRVLDGVRGLFAVGSTSREAFQGYADAALGLQPTAAPDPSGGGSPLPSPAGLTILAYVRAVEDTDFATFLDERRQEGLTGFHRPYQDLPQHYVVDYVAPRTRAQGVDLSPLPDRRIPLEVARDTGRATATDWFVAVTSEQSDGEDLEQIFGIYVPVYEGGGVPGTAAERRAAHLGWVITNAREDILAGRVVPGDVGSGARFELFDGPTVEAGARVIDTRQPDVRLADESVTWTTSPLGHDWTLRYTPTAAQLAQATGGLSPASLFLLIFTSAGVPASFILQLDRARRRAEERAESSTIALRRSEQSLRTLANTAPVAIFDLDADGRLSFGNEAWERLCAGVRSTDALVWLPNLHPDDAPNAFMEWQIARRAGVAMAGRFRVVDTEGAVRWVEATAVPILDAGGAVTRVIGCLVDVSGVVEFERELSAARDQALLASQMKSEFLANVSHEVRTPLNGVIGMAELLLSDELPPGQRERVKALHGAGTYLLDLVDQVLDFSKVEAGKIRIELVAFDLRELLHGIEVMYQPAASERDLRFTVALDDVPRYVVGDPTRLRQVLSNLVGNALKFTPEGTVEVRARTLHTDPTSVTVHLAVTDTGIGIPASEHARIFDPFTQADSSTTRRFGGTGLGLAIAAEVVALMGGEIGMESEAGRGSTFWFTLPLERADGAQVESLDHAFRAVTVDARRPSQLPEAPGGERPRPLPEADAPPRSSVLLVEDNSVNQMVARGLLESLGHHVEVAGDGVEALGLLRGGGEYDAVLMDCQMPRMDGYSTASRIRALKGRIAEVPIIAMTASARAQDHQRCLDAGMDDFIAKPVRRDVLAAALARGLGKR